MAAVVQSIYEQQTAVKQSEASKMAFQVAAVSILDQLDGGTSSCNTRMCLSSMAVLDMRVRPRGAVRTLQVGMQKRR